MSYDHSDTLEEKVRFLRRHTTNKHSRKKSITWIHNPSSTLKNWKRTLYIKPSIKENISSETSENFQMWIKIKSRGQIRVCVCVHMRSCARMHTCTCTHMFMCAVCLWTGAHACVYLGVILKNAAYPPCLTQDLSLTWNDHFCWTGSPVIPGPSCLSLASNGISSETTTPGIFTWVLGIKHSQVLMLSRPGWSPSLDKFLRKTDIILWT